MLNINKLTNIREDNHKFYKELLAQLSRHSDSNPDLLKAAEKMALQMNNMAEVIEYLLQKEDKNG